MVGRLPGSRPIRKSAISVANWAENSVDTCGKGYKLYKISPIKLLHSKNKTDNNEHNNKCWVGSNTISKATILCYVTCPDCMKIITFTKRKKSMFHKQ